MNLYKIYPSNDEYSVFVFAPSLNKAKAAMADHFDHDQPYTMWRGKTLQKGLRAFLMGRGYIEGVIIVETDTQEEYKLIKELGYGFAEDDEMC